MKKIVVLLIAILIVTFILAGYSMNVNSSLSQSIVRLHVIANSDSDADQILKLKVRDAVLKYSADTHTKKSDVKSKLDMYRKTAEKVIKENGYDYTAEAEYGNFAFPTKHYSNISLPAGNYDAVRIIIGEGKGKNWWCVLFPPLCFVDAATNSFDSSKKLKSVLTDSEYDLITAKSSDGKVPVAIKFKIIEIYGKLNGHNKVYAKSRKEKNI